MGGPSQELFPTLPLPGPGAAEMEKGVADPLFTVGRREWHRSALLVTTLSFLIPSPCSLLVRMMSAAPSPTPYLKTPLGF